MSQEHRGSHINLMILDYLAEISLNLVQLVTHGRHYFPILKLGKYWVQFIVQCCCHS